MMDNGNTGLEQQKPLKNKNLTKTGLNKKGNWHNWLREIGKIKLRNL